MLWTQTARGQTVAKLDVKGLRKHLSAWLSREGVIHTHVTHERYDAVHPRRSLHTQLREVGVDRLLGLLLAGLAPEDDPAPEAPFPKGEWEEWATRVLPRAVRPAGDNVLQVPRGVQVSRAPEQGFLDIDIGATPFFEERAERNLSLEGPRFGFSSDFARAITVIGEEGTVLDMQTAALDKAAEVFAEMLGAAGYVRALKRSGVPPASWILGIRKGLL